MTGSWFRRVLEKGKELVKKGYNWARDKWDSYVKPFMDSDLGRTITNVVQTSTGIPIMPIYNTINDKVIPVGDFLLRQKPLPSGPKVMPPKFVGGPGGTMRGIRDVIRRGDGLT